MLSVEDISFGFHRRRLFSNLRFQVSAGQLWQVKGPNGTGKSTLLALIAGLLEPQSGNIAYTNPGGDFTDLRDHMEYLPAEANGLYGRMDAVSNLTFWQRLRGFSPTLAEIHQELAHWNLNHPLLREHFPVEKFSTGMKRRLALARVHLSKTRLWLLDEPLYGLDAAGVASFRQMLERQLANAGAVLMVSHDETIFRDLNAKILDLGSL